MTLGQRRRKIATARRRLDEALAILDEVGADFRDTPGPVARARVPGVPPTRRGGNAPLVDAEEGTPR